MTYNAAAKALAARGSSKAAGDPLRAMYAQLITQAHGGDVQTYYVWLQKTANTLVAAKQLLNSREKAWDVLMGIEANPASRHGTVNDIPSTWTPVMVRKVGKSVQIKMRGR